MLAGGGHTEVVRLLLLHGADPNCMTHPHKIVPLALAIAGCHMSTAEALIQSGARTKLVETQQRSDEEIAAEPCDEPGNQVSEGFRMNPLMSCLNIIPNYESGVSITLGTARTSGTLCGPIARRDNGDSN